MHQNRANSIRCGVSELLCGPFATFLGSFAVFLRSFAVFSTTAYRCTACVTVLLGFVIGIGLDYVGFSCVADLSICENANCTYPSLIVGAV